MTEPYELRFDDGVAFVTLNRPERLNALDTTMRQALAALWDGLGGDPTLRCVVLTGAGRGFCSGADITDLAGARTGAPDVAGELAFLPGRRLDVPVVVAVNGVCAGGGLHFVADADVAIAGESASFLDPHVTVGQVSGIEPASLLLRLPPSVIMRLAVGGGGERLTSAQALTHGLVAEVVADEALPGRAAAFARAVASASPAAVRITRRLLRQAEERLVGEAMELGWQAVREHWGHPDSREGPAAAAERRAPRWVD